MEATQVVALALIQGLTEFLPVSSSGHLVLLPHLVSWEDQGIAFDVAAHVGSLLAVLWYFRRDLVVMSNDWLMSLRRRSVVGQSRLAWAVVVATLPACVFGLVLTQLGVDLIRNPLLVASTTLVFAILLWVADRFGAQSRTESDLSWSGIVFIGLAQVLALVPGTSRSGVTISAAMALGLTRSAAARFSFLLSIPIILAAGSVQILELRHSHVDPNWFSLGLGTLVAAVSAYYGIHVFLRLVERVGMLPFVLYRLVLGGVILVVFL